MKILGGAHLQWYEPFLDRLAYINMDRTQRMIMRPAELVLEEDNASLGLRFVVEHFNIPEETYAGLVRILHIRNTGQKAVTLEMLDGLPLVVPFGVDNFNLKHMRRLVESFVECVNYENGIPFFKGRVKQEDKPEVVPIREGHFYIAFDVARNRASPVPVVVDPAQVFGSVTDYSYPRLFFNRTPFVIPRGAILENRLPCALALHRWKLKPGELRTGYAIIGRAASPRFVNTLARRIRNVRYIARKREEKHAYYRGNFTKPLRAQRVEVVRFVLPAELFGQHVARRTSGQFSGPTTYNGVASLFAQTRGSRARLQRFPPNAHALLARQRKLSRCESKSPLRPVHQSRRAEKQYFALCESDSTGWIQPFDHQSLPALPFGVAPPQRKFYAGRCLHTSQRLRSIM